MSLAQLSRPDRRRSSADTVSQLSRKSRSGAAISVALPIAVVALGLGLMALVQDGPASTTALSLLALGAWALLMLDDRPSMLRIAMLVTATAAAVHVVRSIGTADTALPGLLATACAAAAAGAWARSRHATTGICQVTLMLAASGSAYLALIGILLPEARSLDSINVLAVTLPVGMSWLMLHRMDWSRPPSIGTLSAAISLGIIAVAVTGLLFGAPFIAGFHSGMVPMTAAGSVCVLALAGALLAVEFDNRRLALGLATVPVVLSLHALAARELGTLDPLTAAAAPISYWLRGSIAPPAAVTLFVCAMALCFGAMLRRYRSGATLLWMGGLGAALVALIAVIAILAAIPREVAGAARSGSIPTVLAILFVGIGMMSSRPVRLVDPLTRQRWLPVWVGALVCVGAAWLSNAQFQQDKAERQRAAVGAQLAIEVAVRSALASQSIFAERIGQRLLAIDEPERANAFWLKSIQALAAGNSLDSVHWLDASIRPRASALPDTRPSSPMTATALPEQIAAAARDLRNREGTRNRWVGPLLDGDDGLLRIALVHALRMESGAVEFLVLMFDVNAALDAALATAATDHDLQIAFDSLPGRFHRRGATAESMAWDLRPAATLAIDGMQWTLRVAPSGGDEPRSALPPLVLWSGVVIGALLALTLRLALIGRQRALAAESANASLRRAASWDRAQRDSLVAVATDLPFDDVLALVVRTFEVRFPGVRCGILRTTEPTAPISNLIAPSLPARWREHWVGRTPNAQAGAGGTCIHRNAMVVAGDVEVEALWEGHRAAARAAAVCSAWAAPIRDAHGRTLGAFEVYRSDVREPDEEEREALESVAALAGVAFDREAARTRMEVSRQWFVSLFERSPNAVMAYGLDGRLVDCNEHTVLRSGMPRSALMNTPVEMVVLPEHRAQVSERFALAARGQAQSFETTVRLSQGIRDVVATLIPIAVADDIVGVFVIVADVTERNRVQRDLQNALADLSQRNRELQDFAFVATHDLQEPLRKIQAFSDRVMQRFGPMIPEPGPDYLRRIDASAHRMQVLIDDLLAYSRVATAGQDFADVDLAEVAHDVLADLELRIEESDATIVVGLLPPVHGDRTQLRQLLQNLLSNALKFRAAERPPRVTIEGRTDPERPQWVQLTVEDNGIGFEAVHAERIFAPFQRLHPADAYRGTGIGLAVVRRIVERHRGSVRAIGTLGRGARFEIELPAATGQSQTAAVDSAVSTSLVS